MEDGQIHLRAEILTGDGGECRKGSARFDLNDRKAPAELATRLLDQASPKLRALFAGE
jgi:hydroxymethylbilane synthase